MALKGNIRAEPEAILDNRELQAHGTIDIIGVTGNFQDTGNGAIDNTLALVEGAKFIIPECRNVFAIEGETFSLQLKPEL